jgi:GTP-binding protein
MKRYTFKNAKFVTSAVHPKSFPILRTLQGGIMPEIAVVGRSNVGKSSLLNNLFKQQGLVKTSSTPGKTQMLNFFTLDEALAFVDLPGYGFANAPLSVRKQWGPMIKSYLENRESLKVILCLFDIRRTPGEEDLQMLELAARSQKATILVLTKVDKVGQNEKIYNTRHILNAFNAINLHYVHYSTTKNVGRKELIHMLCDALEDETTEDIHETD